MSAREAKDNTKPREGGSAARNPRRRGPHPKQEKGSKRPPKKLTQRGFVSFLVSPPIAEDFPRDGAEEKAAALERKSSGQTPEFREVEEKLAAAKSSMDPYEDDPDLGAALRAVDIYSSLKSTVVRHYGGQVVTNAWLKIYEIATQMGLIVACRTPAASPQEGKTHHLRAFCDAELPGAFVSGLNHLLCTWYPETTFEWAASSLYPDEDNTAGRSGADTSDSKADGEILGDYYGLFRNNQENWLMDPEMKGDVTDVPSIRALVARAKARLGAIDLYTSDAGIGVESDYLRQEEMTARIHLGQTLVGLMSLRPGGALVVKTYTFVHPFSISLLAVCAGAFDSFYITKPITSRPANSEVYIVGIGFRGLSPEQEDRLLAAVRDHDFSSPLISLDTPATESTVASILDAARKIHMGQQIDFLDEAVSFLKAFKGRVGALRHDLRPIAGRAQAQWLEQNPIRHLPVKCRLSENTKAT
jgi:hypothetical protein